MEIKLKKEEKSEKTHSSRRILWVLGGIFFVLLILLLLSRRYFRIQVRELNQQYRSINEYDYHYAYIVEDANDSFYQEIYQGAKEVGVLEKAYIEFMGQGLSMDYNKNQLLEIAIDAKVDGIILEGDDSEWLKEQIARAAREGIPVVTIGSDSAKSARICFVGINNYTLGHEYANQIATLKGLKRKKVSILMNELADAGQGIINASIRKTLIDRFSEENCAFEIENVFISEEDTFSAEECIHDLFVKNKDVPDIIVCLNELYTSCAIHSIIDCNKVGNVEILGYFTNDTILNAIGENVVNSTIAIDTRQMGEYCVKALNEYLDTGYVSEYLPVDILMVTGSNIKEFIHENEEAQEN